jgi:CheY-like chemotaxis protein
MNLVGNACEASADSAPPVRVRTGAQRRAADWLREAAVRPERLRDEYVWLEVEDRGTGMDAATRARIFDPFYTTRFEGRGLGLAVVHGIVRAHEGALWVDSEPGRGTRFRVLLPRAEAARSAVVAASPAEAAPGRGDLVLVADDDDDVREVAVRFLERGGYRVQSVAGGREALEACAAPDCEIRLVLLDLSMPGMDGEETLRRLRASRPDLPVVVASGFPERSVAARFDGAVRPAAFVRKPFEPDALLARLGEVLRSRASR